MKGFSGCFAAFRDVDGYSLGVAAGRGSWNMCQHTSVAQAFCTICTMDTGILSPVPQPKQNFVKYSA